MIVSSAQRISVFGLLKSDDMSFSELGRCDITEEKYSSSKSVTAVSKKVQGAARKPSDSTVCTLSLWILDLNTSQAFHRDLWEMCQPLMKRGGYVFFTIRHKSRRLSRLYLLVLDDDQLILTFLIHREQILFSSSSQIRASTFICYN